MCFCERLRYLRNERHFVLSFYSQAQEIFCKIAGTLKFISGILRGIFYIWYRPHLISWLVARLKVAQMTSEEPGSILCKRGDLVRCTIHEQKEYFCTSKSPDYLYLEIYNGLRFCLVQYLASWMAWQGVWLKVVRMTSQEPCPILSPPPRPPHTHTPEDIVHFAKWAVFLFEYLFTSTRLLLHKKMSRPHVSGSLQRDLYVFDIGFGSLNVLIGCHMGYTFLLLFVFRALHSWFVCSWDIRPAYVAQ